MSGLPIRPMGTQPGAPCIRAYLATIPGFEPAGPEDEARKRLLGTRLLELERAYREARDNGKVDALSSFECGDLEVRIERSFKRAQDECCHCDYRAPSELMTVERKAGGMRVSLPVLAGHALAHHASEIFTNSDRCFGRTPMRELVRVLDNFPTLFDHRNPNANPSKDEVVRWLDILRTAWGGPSPDADSSWRLDVRVTRSRENSNPPLTGFFEVRHPKFGKVWLGHKEATLLFDGTLPLETKTIEERRETFGPEVAPTFLKLRKMLNLSKPEAPIEIQSEKK